MKQKLNLLILVFLFHFTMNAQIYDNGSLSAESNFVAGGTFWTSNTVTYFFSNETPDIAGTNSERNAVREAFKIWADWTNLNFVESSSASNSDIVISWGAGNHGDNDSFDGLGGVLAHAFAPPANGTTHNLTGDIHFDEAETWTTTIRNNGANPRDLVTIAAHEIGHSLGLQHTNVAGSLMVPNYTGSHRFLCLDDIQGIQSIYGSITNISAIQGSDILCGTGNAVYTINGVCDFNGINWTSSSNLTIVSNTGETVTVRKTGNGNNGWIQANVQGVVMRKNITTETNVYLSSYRFNSTGSISATASGGTAPYNWTWHNNVTGSNTTWVSSSPTTSKYVGCSDGIIYVKSNTACGARTSSTFIDPCGTGGYYMTVYPNPADSEINVLFAENSSHSNSSVIKSSITPKDLSDINLVLLDLSGSPVKNKKFKAGTQNTKLNVSNVKKGMYFLKITGKEIDETHRIVIE